MQILYNIENICKSVNFIILWANKPIRILSAPCLLLDISYISGGDGARGNFLQCIEKIDKKVSSKDPSPFSPRQKLTTAQFMFMFLKRTFFYYINQVKRIDATEF